MSLMRSKKWLLKVSHQEKERIAEAKRMAEELGLHTATAFLLMNRGCADVNSAKQFLSKGTERLHDPFLMKDMKKAVTKILETVKEGKRITIYGDYDVDGVTSVSILLMYIRSIGGNAGYYIPSRLNEGYGMSEASLLKLKEEGTELIITVDTGITAVDEAELVNSMGMELIVTDHHECHSETPKAYAVVNPKQFDCEYPFKELAGVGVVFKLICALEISRCSDKPVIDCIRKVSEKYIDLVAIGTIADVMPLKDENRLIVSEGLRRIETKPRVSIEVLIAASNGDARANVVKRKITSGFVGFTIAPRINAAGRIRNASIAVELFLSEDRETAIKYANELCDINVLRQQEENKIIEEAYEKIEAEHDFKHDPVIILDHESWHHGIIGIVASRITERYGKPCVLISFNEIGSKHSKGDTSDIGKGSGRSIKGMNLVDALTHCKDLLVKYGGHELAAGLTIERDKLEDFKTKINDYARGCFDGEKPVTYVEAEYEMEPDEITMEQAGELFKLEPYGVSNPVPVFATFGMKVSNISSVGQGKHSKIILSKDSLVVTAMCFRKSPEDLCILAGDEVDVMFNLDINEYQNMKSLQLIIKEIRLSEAVYEKEKSEKEFYSRIKEGSFDFSKLTSNEISEIIPERKDFADVYNLIKREIRLGYETFSIRQLLRLLQQNGVAMRYVKLKYILLVFEEMNILGVDRVNEANEVYKFSYVYVKNKADLDKSHILRKLRAASLQR